jgi:hypothetical protein
MRPTDVKRIREAIEAARKFAHETPLDGCDVGDVDEILASIEQQLTRPLPNTQTLATYMNSLARSLRPQHHGAQIVAQLHDVMSDAGIRIESEI